jgi:hypothetical protein
LVDIACPAAIDRFRSHDTQRIDRRQHLAVKRRIALKYPAPPLLRRIISFRK